MSIDIPDELYTLRSQYYLGHYNLCLEEAKALSRRPLSGELKIERDEFQLRAWLGLKQYDKIAIASSSYASTETGVRAIALQAEYDSPSSPLATKNQALKELQSLVSVSSDNSKTCQVIAAQTFLRHGDMTREALQCVYEGATIEQLALSVQIYLRMDRLDLAKQALGKMKQNDEEAVLTQLCACYVAIYVGRSQAVDAVHIVRSLSEQYGTSVMLLNLSAAAHMACGEYSEAETFLIEAMAEGDDVDTFINLIVCYQHQGKFMETEKLLQKVRSVFPNHPFVQGLSRVEGAFERESIKYKVTA